MYGVNVISFSSSILRSREFFEFLKKPEFGSRIFSGDYPPEADALRTSDINLFLLDAISLANTDVIAQIRACLATACGAINLCLVTELSQEMVPECCTLFHDFIFWPCRPRELEARIGKFQHCFHRRESESRKRELLEQFAAMNLTGQSRPFLDAVSLIKRMARCQAAVLIEGETGTGKENAARAIHYLGARAEHGFVPVNCAAIPDELFESELFGHEQGAFTDAKLAQKGLVEIAQGGTLFLDEVDSLTPKAQAALLRFLQTQEYRPLGAKHTQQANVRIVAATNADLRKKSRTANFREDLYFRLNVLHLVMPALRERKSDIPLLADSLLQKFAAQHRAAPKVISRALIEDLRARSWPGNIRELENFLLRAFLLTESSVIEPPGPDLAEPERSGLNDQAPPREGFFNLSFQEAKSRAINEFEKSYLEQVMVRARGNVTTAARLAKKERRALGKLLQKYDITRLKDSYRQER